MSSDFDWAESEDFEIDPGIRFKLDLPTTRERLRLIIESDPEESRGTLGEQGAEPLRPENDSLSNTVVGLAGLGNEDPSTGWKTRVGAGVKVRWPLNPYARASAERLWQLGDGPWQLSNYNRASWFEDDGYSARTQWDIGPRWTRGTCALSANCNGRRITTRWSSPRAHRSTACSGTAVPFATPVSWSVTAPPTRA
ncbi:hypothetical protein ULF88_00585 [Halopseudomonas pachastrellae]|nr:hypothetical protein [Halopseudomonas pachastrellae]